MEPCFNDAFRATPNSAVDSGVFISKSKKKLLLPSSVSRPASLWKGITFATASECFLKNLSLRASGGTSRTSSQGDLAASTWASVACWARMRGMPIFHVSTKTIKASAAAAVRSSSNTALPSVAPPSEAQPRMPRTGADGASVPPHFFWNHCSGFFTTS